MGAALTNGGGLWGRMAWGAAEGFTTSVYARVAANWASGRALGDGVLQDGLAGAFIGAFTGGFGRAAFGSRTHAADEIIGGTTTTIREEGGIANALIPGILPGNEVARHQRALKQFKVEIKFHRPLNEFDPMAGKGGIISLRHPKDAVPRGVFFEEVQHALDWHTGNRWSLPHRNSPQFVEANTRVHIGTFERMALNRKRFGLTGEEVQRLLQQVDAWKQGLP